MDKDMGKKYPEGAKRERNFTMKKVYAGPERPAGSDAPSGLVYAGPVRPDPAIMEGVYAGPIGFVYAGPSMMQQQQGSFFQQNWNPFNPEGSKPAEPVDEFAGKPTKFCRNCGARMLKTYKFCPECGGDVSYDL